jgi:hypothetical protein
VLGANLVSWTIKSPLVDFGRVKATDEAEAVQTLEASEPGKLQLLETARTDKAG